MDYLKIETPVNKAFKDLIAKYVQTPKVENIENEKKQDNRMVQKIIKELFISNKSKIDSPETGLFFDKLLEQNIISESGQMKIINILTNNFAMGEIAPLISKFPDNVLYNQAVDALNKGSDELALKYVQNLELSDEIRNKLMSQVTRSYKESIEKIENTDLENVLHSPYRYKLDRLMRILQQDKFKSFQVDTRLNRQVLHVMSKFYDKLLKTPPEEPSLNFFRQVKHNIRKKNMSPWQYNHELYNFMSETVLKAACLRINLIDLKTFHKIKTLIHDSAYFFDSKLNEINKKKIFNLLSTDVDFKQMLPRLNKKTKLMEWRSFYTKLKRLGLKKHTALFSLHTLNTFDDFWFRKIQNPSPTVQDFESQHQFKTCEHYHIHNRFDIEKRFCALMNTNYFIEHEKNSENVFLILSHFENTVDKTQSFKLQNNILKCIFETNDGRTFYKNLVLLHDHVKNSQNTLSHT